MLREVLGRPCLQELQSTLLNLPSSPWAGWAVRGGLAWVSFLIQRPRKEFGHTGALAPETQLKLKTSQTHPAGWEMRKERLQQSPIISSDVLPFSPKVSL